MESEGTNSATYTEMGQLIVLGFPALNEGERAAPGVQNHMDDGKLPYFLFTNPLTNYEVLA